ncbi:prepilin-type N-terminal cleavage/methylation domain-containing protein [Rhizomicrobium electricum]|uniref:prepilin-type N-terminal cleavage/methylation domain-containing protein n=1 Tax=Rhizomicrobium electricum TaxID=480070 RepID=UPI00141F8C9F|nr:prepilin-type N-terminal cleavage/methylation domain-containing protein [Rhizomicrobium electricum]NIJ48768.1 prepilin-type N-terminal cleavage/methylation domain-containing protein [Rhizomicrobium electricum]
MSRLTLSDGYTLVELVVVMLLLGLLALACESGLHFGCQVWSRAVSSFGKQDQLVINQSILRSLLAHALPRLKGNVVTFTGETTEIRFDGAPPQAFQDGGTAHVVLRILKTRRGTALALDLRSIADPQHAKHAILATDVDLLHMSYLDASSQTQTWLSHWRDRNRLPDAVRIESGDPRVFPTLIVHLPIVESASCRPDPVTMACRKI